jgi:hypothetical protein
MATKKIPEFPITPEQVAEFKRLLPIWVELLNLGDWRITFTRKRPIANHAHVEIFDDDRLARISIGRDWGSNPPSEFELEDTLVHELLHVKVFDLAKSAEKHNAETVNALEHAVIIPLSKTLVRLRNQK